MPVASDWPINRLKKINIKEKYSVRMEMNIVNKINYKNQIKAKIAPAKLL